MDAPAKQNARVFFALWPDAAERAALAAWQSLLNQVCGGRVMRADTLHVTLVFVGSVAPHLIDVLKQAAREVQGESFRLVLDAAHYWKHNHIVYATPEIVPPALPALVHALEERLESHGLPFDKRPYKPHSTLLRDAQWTRDPLPPMRKIEWEVKDFVLLQSVQRERGVDYEVLARFGLER